MGCPHDSKGLLSHGWLYFMVFLFLAGCMGGRTLTLDVGYDTKREPDWPFTEAPTLKVVLIPFEKGKGVKDTIGKWVGIRGKEDTLKTSKPIDESVTKAVFEYLNRVGFNVSTASRGASLDDFKTPPPDFVIHGVVETFETEASSTIGATSVKTRISLKVRIKNVKDGSLLTINIDGDSEPRTVVAFDPDIFENTVNDVLSETVERIFTNTVLEDGILKPRD